MGREISSNFELDLITYLLNCYVHELSDIITSGTTQLIIMMIPLSPSPGDVRPRAILSLPSAHVEITNESK